MTTTVKIHVNGNYRTTVYQQNAGADVRTVTVIDACGVAGGVEKSFGVPHPAAATFEIREEYIADYKAPETSGDQFGGH